MAGCTLHTPGGHHGAILVMLRACRCMPTRRYAQQFSTCFATEFIGTLLAVCRVSRFYIALRYRYTVALRYRCNSLWIENLVITSGISQSAEIGVSVVMAPSSRDDKRANCRREGPKSLTSIQSARWRSRHAGEFWYVKGLSISPIAKTTQSNCQSTRCINFKRSQHPNQVTA